MNESEKLNAYKDEIKIIQAFVDGKEIEWRWRGLNIWKVLSECDEAMIWNFDTYEYRVKTEPRVIYVNEYPDGRWGCYYTSATEAETNSKSDASRVAVKYQEVIE